MSQQLDGIKAVEELIETIELPTTNNDESIKSSQTQQHSVALLFVSQYYANDFPVIIQQAYECMLQKCEITIEPKYKPILLSILGGGVVANTQEFDDPFGSSAAMSLLSGILPKDASATGFYVNQDSNDNSQEAVWKNIKKKIEEATPRDQSDGSTGRSPRSHIVFADPFIDSENLLLHVGNDEDVIVGGLSCPNIARNTLQQQPSIGLNDQALPAGSATGISFSGNFGIQAIVAQGCRPIGPTFTITSVSGNILNSIDNFSAIGQLSRISQEASNQDKLLIQRGGLLVGITAAKHKENYKSPQDFLIRQIIGITKLGKGEGALAIGVKDLVEGEKLQFHLRDAEAAKKDMRVMVERAKTERLFVGPVKAGIPVAAIQISCVARGNGLFGEPNVDITQTCRLLQESTSPALDSENINKNINNGPAISGFFANGEFGPVGISAFDSTSDQASGRHVHGFTTVIGLFCDFPKTRKETENDGSVLSGIANETFTGDAWG